MGRGEENDKEGVFGGNNVKKMVRTLSQNLGKYTLEMPSK